MRTIKEEVEEYIKKIGKLSLREKINILIVFEAGVRFAQKWTYIEEELPNYYQTVLADNGEYMAIVARVSDGNEDFYPICGTNVYMYPNPTKWKFVTLK